MSIDSSRAAPRFMGLLLVCSFLSPQSAVAQRKHEGTVDGDPLVRVIGRDGIHSIDKPKMVTVKVADKIMPDYAPVLGVHDERRARAYPIWVLDGHEIVNDWLGEVPIAATW